MVNETVDSEQALDDKIQIEVVYGLPNRQVLMVLSVKNGTTVEEGIIASGITAEFDDIDLAINKVGIWNRSAKLSDILKDLDRIEIYRPLIADPKEVRKRRAEKAKDEGRADKVTGGRVDPRRAKTPD
jgi:putative ubiquitin-RnfH superfamily antitoxin RatB of RatAB toxin-antitoxin module